MADHGNKDHHHEHQSHTPEFLAHIPRPSRQIEYWKKQKAAVEKNQQRRDEAIERYYQLLGETTKKCFVQCLTRGEDLDSLVTVSRGCLTQCHIGVQLPGMIRDEMQTSGKIFP
eukprot:TRINITY_DN228_c0_g1_i1.p2 TRINITY_DN228_c0_g1~~TRINITY_DN228_c0_g1_i1.p2  ORF type:complete len:133 (-),score=65.31 TRINITY_DN228_c0_g1_i1:234-575(-)